MCECVYIYMFMYTHTHTHTHVWTCSHRWIEQGISGGHANLMELQGCEHRSHYRTWCPHATLKESVWSETCTPVACWRSFWMALAVLLQIPVLLWLTLSSCPPVTACLLVSPPCSWSCAGRHTKPLCKGTCGSAMLEELENLCKLIG